MILFKIPVICFYIILFVILISLDNILFIILLIYFDIICSSDCDASDTVLRYYIPVLSYFQHG